MSSVLSVVGLTAACYPANIVKLGFSTVIGDKAKLFEKAVLIPIDIDHYLESLSKVLEEVYKIEKV